MTTTNPNPFSSPASQPPSSLAEQYPMSGVPVMQNNFTGPRAALSAYRNGTSRGGVLAKPMLAGPGPGGTPKDTPMRNPPGGTVPNASEGTGALASGPQTMQAAPTDGGMRTGPQQGLHGYLASLAGGGDGGTAMGGGRGMGAMRPRVPGVMNPTRMRY